MGKDLVLRLRYVGMLAKLSHREYGFHIEDKDKGIRLVVLTIDNGHFADNRLMFQEAPDLCYQKLLADLRDRAGADPIRGRVRVTESDIAAYRDTHPTVKTRKSPARHAAGRS